MLDTIQSMLGFMPPNVVEFLMAYVVPLLIIVVKILALVLPLMGAVAYLTYAERKIIGFIQVRVGPNRVGFFGLKLWGLGQPIADAVKLLFKETILPTNANTFLFIAAPILSIGPPYGRNQQRGDLFVHAEIYVGSSPTLLRSHIEPHTSQ